MTESKLMTEEKFFGRKPSSTENHNTNLLSEDLSFELQTIIMIFF